MTITRLQVETVLLKRCDAIMDVADMFTVATGTNTDLNDPISKALRLAGFTVTDISQPVDSDFTDTEDYIDQILDAAEIRLLQSVANKLKALVDITSGPIKENLSQHATGVEARLKSLQDDFLNNYPDAETEDSEIITGNLRFDFAAHRDDLDEVGDF